MNSVTSCAYNVKRHALCLSSFFPANSVLLFTLTVKMHSKFFPIHFFLHMTLGKFYLKLIIISKNILLLIQYMGY